MSSGMPKVILEEIQSNSNKIFWGISLGKPKTILEGIDSIYLWSIYGSYKDQIDHSQCAVIGTNSSKLSFS